MFAKYCFWIVLKWKHSFDWLKKVGGWWFQPIKTTFNQYIVFHDSLSTMKLNSQLEKKKGMVMIRIFSKENMALVKEIDKSVKNKFRFEWLEKTVTIKIKVDKKTHNVVEKVGDFIAKCDIPGKAKCTYCNDIISYGSRGYLSLVEHASRAKKHAEKVRLSRLRNSLGSAFTKSNVVDKQSRAKYRQKTSTSAPLTRLNDKKTHSEVGTFILVNHCHCLF